MRYIARAPVTVVCDRRPGDTFAAEPKEVVHLVEAGQVEPLDATETSASGTTPVADTSAGAPAKAGKTTIRKKPAK